ncbi:alpha/beta fold hydrolase [Lysobacter yangpyeongensis]|uniref:Proline iminopeptidase n=1 Tax=Lysobacter yangpyeongensis TaxID=346182 RepID=A0ABW0SIK3_9GAMM
MNSIGRFASSLLLTALASASVAHADDATTARKPFGQDDARAIIAQSRKILSPQGIEEVKAVEIGGIRQWISVRGNDRRNPVLLYVHGGPGSVEMVESYGYQRPWEDFFTVVQWDQRGAGKTFASNTPEAMAPRMSIDGMVADAEEMIRYLMATYGKKKIFVLGHSWGSVVGEEVARRHPEWLHAYIGAGQIADMRASEAIGYEWALQQARTQGNQEAIRELEALAPYPGPAGKLTIERIGTQRKWNMYYGGLAWGRTDFKPFDDARKLSPDYSNAEVAAIDQGSLFSLQHLLTPLASVDFSRNTRFDTPVFLFNGRHDYTTSFEVAARWFETLQAPLKRMFWFDDSAHMMMQEQPGRFLMHLVNDVRPLAVKAGDAPPEEEGSGK